MKALVEFLVDFVLLIEELDTQIIIVTKLADCQLYLLA
jgi:hypothetical protein